MRPSLLLAAVAVLSLPASMARADEESGHRIQLTAAGGSVDGEHGHGYGEAHTFFAADVRYGYAATRYFEVDLQARVDGLDAEPTWMPQAALGARISPIHFGHSDVGIRFAFGVGRRWHPYRPEQSTGTGGLISVGLDTRIGIRPRQHLVVGPELTLVSVGETNTKPGIYLTAGLRAGIVFSL